jgi:hypothetical protein
VPHESPSLGTYLAIVLSSTSENEVAMAVRQLRKLAMAAGLDGHDIAKAVEHRGKLLEAAQTLKTERDDLLGEVERLKQLSHANGAGNSFAGQLWQTASMPATVDNRHAGWLAGLRDQGRIYLTTKESDFVDSCAGRRRLTEPMCDWLQDLVRNAIARTGEAPPA